MDIQSDSYYIEKVLAGDRNAYANLVDRYKSMVYTIALKILRNNEEAEETAQDAFIKAFQSLSKFKQESKFSTWLYRIVYNAAISKTRKRVMQKVELNTQIIDNYSSDEIENNILLLDEADKSKLINKLLSTLSPEENAIITLYYYDEHSTDEIAEIMGLSQSNVKVRLFRIRNKMNYELQNYLMNDMKEVYR
jgi:RNA polymerase sigma-70 factor (ECF subfamily)